MYDYTNIVNHLRRAYPFFDGRFTTFATIKEMRVNPDSTATLRLVGTALQTLEHLYEPRSLFLHSITSIEFIPKYKFRLDQYLEGEYKFQNSAERFGTVMKITLGGNNATAHDYTLDYKPKSTVQIRGVEGYATNVLDAINTTHRLVGYGKDYLLVMPIQDTDVGSLTFYNQINETQRIQLKNGFGLTPAQVVDRLEIAFYTQSGIMDLEYVSTTLNQNNENESVYNITNIANPPSSTVVIAENEVIDLGTMVHLIPETELAFANISQVEKGTETKIVDELWVLPLNGVGIDDPETRPDLNHLGFTQGQHLDMKIQCRFSVLAVLVTKDDIKKQNAILDAQNKILANLCRCLVGLDQNFYTKDVDVSSAANITFESHSPILQNRLIYVHEYIFRFTQELTKTLTVQGSGILSKINGGTRALKGSNYDVFNDLSSDLETQERIQSSILGSYLEVPNEEINGIS